jgi:hypothetical protein
VDTQAALQAFEGDLDLRAQPIGSKTSSAVISLAGIDVNRRRKPDIATVNGCINLPSARF